MPTNIVDVDAFTSPVVAPTSGDPRTAASIVQGLQPLGNRTIHLKKKAALRDHEFFNVVSPDPTTLHRA
jgi:hypothetical protein